MTQKPTEPASRRPLCPLVGAAKQRTIDQLIARGIVTRASLLRPQNQVSVDSNAGVAGDQP